jgi:hypothetical protein
MFVPLLILLQRHFGISTLYFIHFAPSAHLIQSWNLFQTSNFNTAQFCIQYCTLFIQYCTKCAILHTKIGPVLRRSTFPNIYLYIYIYSSTCVRCILLARFEMMPLFHGHFEFYSNPRSGGFWLAISF